MSKNRHTEITEVPFRASIGAPHGVEVMDFAGLLARARSHGIDPCNPLRPAFHHLVTVRCGALRYSLDFTEHTLPAGAWLWARPGQILQYGPELTEAHGTVVLFQPGFLSTPTAEATRTDQLAAGQPLIPRSEYKRQALRLMVDLLESEHQRRDDLPPDVHIEVVRHLLAVLVLRLAHLNDPLPGDARGNEAYQRLQQAVERDFARTHRVEDYAKQLGYSVRTLTRATRAATGSGAKQMIDDRVLLEAKRLLVHTELSSTAVAERLGFPGPTVFTRFFRQRTGDTPTAFRSRARGNLR
ncbi:helix-turn-helix transcriptional regulator [Pseudonocardia sp. CA-142604]|uniref:AraC family transcriptional regulator n=1 Tax=Pseudonocardia sp. CA-142604 TaxID=3240024 RepID=UPI003D8B6A7A